MNVDYELKSKNGNNAFHYSCLYNDDYIFNELIEKVNCDEKNLLGETPLMMCASEGNEIFIKQLL